jgi:hypothetical protein
MTIVEERVLKAISDGRVRTSQLMKDSHKLDSSPEEIREAVWSLLDDGRIDITPDRFLFEIEKFNN